MDDLDWMSEAQRLATIAEMAQVLVTDCTAACMFAVDTGLNVRFQEHIAMRRLEETTEDPRP